MSKAVKKVTKSVKKVAGKIIKTFDPGLDQLLGLSRQDEQKKQAERMAKIAETQAKQQQTNTIEQARAAAMQMTADTDRQRILAEQSQQQNATPDDTGAAATDVAPVATDAVTRRKKFQTPQVGGTGGGGTSIRL
ncbi:virion assembly protein [Providencia phage PSTNGR1]|uniref:Virion assembly protein n=1 Tax=Providencia phage PSTNGR1 TaxID=2783542 RepID=A0A873WMS9_9CAUD|nr:virion assembly protein [Providencia phage PSTNGR1]